MSRPLLGERNLRLAEAAAEEGKLEQARELYVRAIGCYAADDPQGALARVGLAAVHAERDQLEEAWEVLSVAEPLLARGGAAPRHHARALNQMGLIRRRQGAQEDARRLYARARAVAAEAGDLRQQAVALRNLAGIERGRGELRAAVDLLAQSAELLEAEGETRSVALIWRQVRTCELEASEPDPGKLIRACAAARRELAIREALGERTAIAATLLEAARVARLIGEFAEAEAWLKRAAELRAHGGDLEGAAKVLLLVADLFLAMGRPRAARRKLEAARDALGEQGPVDLRAELWRAFAETDLALLDAFAHDDDPLVGIEEEGLDPELRTDVAIEQRQLLRRAHEEADEALTLARQTSAGRLRALALRTRARALAHKGEHEPAREQFRASVSAVEEERPDPLDPARAYATFLAYGSFLARSARRGRSEDGLASRDYLERASILAEEAAEHGVSPLYAARAQAALCQHHLGLEEREPAKHALERAAALLGGEPAPAGTPRGALRRALARLGRRLSGEALASDRLLKLAEEAARDHVARVEPDGLRDALYDLRRLQEITKALNSELDLDRLLDLIIDAAIELAGAERGFLILSGDSPDKVAFKVARNIERTEVERPDRKVSNTIARAAIESGAPVVTGDAASDARFAGAMSVAEQRLKSVASVPLRVKGTITGALYLDHRYKDGLFGARAVELLEGLADHAAVALENARLLRENEERAAALAAEQTRLQREVASQTIEVRDLKERLAERTKADGARYRYDQIVGRAPAMQQVFRMLDKVVTSTIPVFIQGESGTGKELIARAVHYNSARAQGPFVSENFAAIVDELLESELFGHVKGSFTGAIDDKKGLFERAHGGTIFLDEVGDLSERMQKELLRVLEEREVRPVGGDQPFPVDVRVISATHRDLKQMVAEGSFRQDLFYRLHVFALRLPPLRERREDIPLLAERFLEDYRREHKGGPRSFDTAAIRKLMAHHWPGNVRELKNFVDRSALLARGEAILGEEIQLEDAAGGEGPRAVADDLSLTPWNEAKDTFAVRYLRSTLSRANGNVSLAARESGMLRQAFQRLIKRHGVDPRDYRRRR